MVLTILALSLALVTQTEVQVGSNERTVNRTFYAADSGLGHRRRRGPGESATYTGTTVILNKISVGAGSSSAANVADRVTISALVPIQTVRCDWCPANANGVPKFFKVNHAVTATAQRIAWTGTGDPPADATLLGQKTLSAMFEFQPWPSPPVESIPTDSATLAQVKF